MTGLRYVIQTFENPPRYGGADNYWKVDINLAARFPTEAAALRRARTLTMPATVSEHMWLRGLKLLY